MTLAQRTLFVLAFAVAAGTAVYKAHQASSLVQQLQTVRQTEDNLRDENLQLRQELDRATKRMGLLSEEAAARQGLTETQVRLLPDPPRAAPPPTNLFARFQNGAPNLTAEQVKTFLMSGRTNAGRLLAAYRTSGDRSLLKDAVTKYPNNAQVTFEAVFDSTLPPEQQRQALDAFKQSAPDNALANYLSALDYFKSGQRDRAIEEFAAASTKRFDDYTLEREQDNQEAYLSAGYSAVEAQLSADGGLTLPQLGQLKQLAQQMVEVGKSYNQSGDQSSAQAAFQMVLDLGQRYGDAANSPTLISHLVGIAIESMALSGYDPKMPLGENGQTVQERLDQIKQDRAAIKQLNQQASPLMPTLSDEDVLSYLNRRRSLGETAALQWVLGKFGQQ